MPFYYLEILKGDPRMVGTLLAVFLGAGAAGTLAPPASGHSVVFIAGAAALGALVLWPLIKKGLR